MKNVVITASVVGPGRREQADAQDQTQKQPQRNAQCLCHEYFLLS